MPNMVAFKPARFQCPEFLSFIRTHVCVICGFPEVDAHHMKSVGSGGSDLTAIPLCREHHSEWHTVGKDSFCERYQCDPFEMQAEFLKDFIESKWDVFTAKEPGKASN